jgi:3-dehydroquinate synthetase
MDADFFTMLETNISAVLSRDPAALAKVVAHCCRLKADVVQSDEREISGRRAILNYGHTVCHALETVTGYGQFLHGEAVSIGMMCEARLAQILGRVDDRFIKRQHDLLAALGLPVDMPRLDADRLLAIMQHDKKTENGRLRFVLPARMGHAEMVDAINAAEVQRAMQ